MLCLYCFCCLLKYCHDNDKQQLEWLNSQGSKQEPWFLYCSFTLPHPPYDSNATFIEQVDVKSIPIPDWIPEDEMHVYDYYMSMNKNMLKKYNDSTIMGVREAYFAMNVEIDQIIGNLVNVSNKLGYNESNTVYIYTSDHGVKFFMEHSIIPIWQYMLIYTGNEYGAPPRLEKFIV